MIINDTYAKSLISLAFMAGNNKVSTIDKDSFPIIEESKLEHLIYSSVNSPDSIYIYAYFRYFGRKEYLDVYFAGCFGDDVGYYRVVLEPGKRLSQEDEELFVTLCTDPRVKSTIYLINLFNTRVKENYSCVHFTGYDNPRTMGKALMAFYFSLLNSGIFEILYKASFKVIPEHIMEVCGVNYIGSNPSDIVANMPLKLLRILDNNDLVYNLFTESGQNEAKLVFDRYASYLNESIPSPAQWRYLCVINAEDIPFNRKIYDVLIDIDDVRIVDIYMEYFRLKEALFDYFPQENGVPDIDKMTSRMSDLKTINELVAHKDFYDYRIKCSVPSNVFEYENDTYVVRFPKSIKDFTREAAYQRNCLLSMYLGRVLNGTECIGFIRKQDDPDRPFITFSFYKGKIYEAKGQYNRRLTVDERMFLDDYASVMGFKVELPEEALRIPDEVRGILG